MASDEQQPRPCRRRLERLGRALEAGGDGRRAGVAAASCSTAVDRVAEGDAGLEVEGDRHRGQLAEVVDRQRADAPRERRPRRSSGTSVPVATSARRAVERPPGRAGTAAAAPGSPSTGWSACRWWRPAACRRRCRARPRSARRVTPSAEALSRSMSTFTCGFLICRSLVTSCRPGSSRSFASSIGRRACRARRCRGPAACTGTGSW